MYNIMLVDDEVRMIESLSENVDWSECGIAQVYKADSMKAAIDIIRKRNVDILVCDIEMPNGSGLDLMAWLRDHHYDNLPCIILTCHPEFDFMRKAIQLKCYDYMLKPINYREFAIVLKNLILQIKNNAPVDFDAERHENDGKNIEFEVKRYVQEHLQENIMISDIAEYLHFNPKYLMRAFKNQTGAGILEYITDLRMKKAKKLLKTTRLPIKEVASQVGYGDYAYFSRVFGKECGISPKEYRNS